MFRKKLEKLRARPQEERTAIAASVAIGVVAILFVGWIIFFFRSIESTPAPDMQNVSDSLDQSGLPQAQQQLQQAYGSTTQFIESQGNVELEEIGTSTDSTSDASDTVQY